MWKTQRSKNKPYKKINPNAQEKYPVSINLMTSLRRFYIVIHQYQVLPRLAFVVSLWYQREIWLVDVSQTFEKAEKIWLHWLLVALPITNYFASIFKSSFPVGRVAGGSSPRRTRNTPTVFCYLWWFCCFHTKTEPIKLGDVFTPPGSWWNSGPLSRGCNQQDLLGQFFVRHCGLEIA